MSKVFISYNRQSEAMARSLVDDIERLGYDVWFDQELSGGQAWWDQILAFIRECDLFVFLLDPQTLDSTACKRELGYARVLGKPIPPVLVADGVSTNLLPPELSEIQFIDYRKQDRTTALSLARALASIPPSKPLPDPLPTPPEVPVTYLGGLTRKIDTASPLSYEDQSALVLELRRSLRNPEAAADTRALLERLRSRRDLFATVAEEIDDLLISPRQTSSIPPPTHVAQPASEVDTSLRTSTAPSSTATHRTTPHKRWRGALVGAAVGVALGVITVLATCSEVDTLSTLLVLVALFAIPGAITGAITGTDWRVIAFALAGFGLVFFATRPVGFLEAMLALVAAILGAIAGAIAKKVRGWK